MFKFADTFILSKLKSHLGLEHAEKNFFGGAPLKRNTIEYFWSLNIILQNLYGMSETTGPHTTMTDSKFNFKSAGFCIPGCDLRIDNPNENGEGEICMRGRNVMMGYLKDEEQTMQTIDDYGYIHSGDLGKLDD